MKYLLLSLIGIICFAGTVSAQITYSVDEVSVGCENITITGIIEDGSAVVMIDGVVTPYNLVGDIWDIQDLSFEDNTTHVARIELDGVRKALKEFTVACIVESEPVQEVVVSGNGDPMGISQVWGLVGHQTPRVESGAVVTDFDTCPVWYSNGCFDLTDTQYYVEQMLELGRQLRENGQSHLFPMFIYWVN